MATKNTNAATAAATTTTAPDTAPQIVTVRVLTACIHAGGLIAGKGATVKLPLNEAQPHIDAGRVKLL